MNQENTNEPLSKTAVMVSADCTHDYRKFYKIG